MIKYISIDHDDIMLLKKLGIDFPQKDICKQTVL